ncbi:unnamed protein product [Parnassius apollo]|uniref:(apollo) hypothetical protein n=1 Tax=Parnassius apollo TaxID=110799 RepID=A0A8S3W6R8_PARAO|nr:unnamed protein product [Parnassius apollo]
MKQSYQEDIMLCFVEGFGNSAKRGYNKSSRELSESDVSEAHLPIKSSKGKSKKVSVHTASSVDSLSEEIDIRKVGGKSLRLSSGERLKTVSELKRSFSDRFSRINHEGKKKATKGILTIKKNW